MARPPKPTAMHRLNGTYRPDRHGARATEPFVEGVPQAPEWLDGDALEFWNYLVPLLVEAGVLSPLDGPVLAGLCCHWRNWSREQERYNAGEGHIYSVSNAWSAFERAASKFGLTPVDRVRLAAGPKSEESEFLQLIGKPS